MPVGNGKKAEKTKGRSLDVLSAKKKGIVVVKTAFLCMAHGLVIAIANVNGDQKYKSYRNGRCLYKHVEDFLKASSVDLSNIGSFEELQQFQEYLSGYKILVFDALSPHRLLFSGNSLRAKELYLLYDPNNVHYNVITNINAAMAKRYICNACDTLKYYTHKCDKAYSLCTATPPCTKDQTNYCSRCNRYFLSEKCFQNNLTLRLKSKLVCQWKHVRRKCSYLAIDDSKQECNKRFCIICNKKQPFGHFCYLVSLTSNKLPDNYM